MRLAPSAARVATSRVRIVMRASSMFATFAQAAARTRPTPANSIHSDRRTGLVTSSLSPMIRAAIFRCN